MATDTATTTRIGFVGLGNMGGNMAARFLAAGYAVYGEERSHAHAEELVHDGLQWRDTPREVAEAADIVFTSLPDDDVLDSGRLGARRHPRRPRRRADLGRHEHGQPAREPRACRARARTRGGDARRAGIGQRPAGAERNAHDHGRRRRARLRARRAGPARAGHAHARRRERAGPRAQARDQHQPRRADARVLRGAAAGRTLRHRPRARDRRDDRRARSARRC